MAPTTSEFSLVGLSHKTAPVEVRERLAVSASNMPELLARMHQVEGVEELVLVSTCNRVEAYLYGAPQAAEAMRQFLAAQAGPESLAALYIQRGAKAIDHLFEVASSLDSMILGEPQILGQVKDAFGAAQQAGTVGGALSHACQSAFTAAKRVRTETAIGSAPVSMASAAVELARKIFGTLDGRTVLLVGAGKMSELTAKHLGSGNSRILVTNRTFERGRELAEKVGGAAHSFDMLPALLAQADIVVSSTAAPRPILTVPVIHSVIKARHYRPLFLVDLAVPRDVEAGVGKLENVYAYDVDDLGQVVAEGLAAREGEARKARAILRDELERFMKARQLRDAMPVLLQLRARAEELARQEAERTLDVFGEALTPKQRKSIEAMGKAIVNKLLHAPTLRLREASKGPADEAAALALMVAQLFDLEPPASAAAPRANGAAAADASATSSSSSSSAASAAASPSRAAGGARNTVVPGGPGPTEQA